MDRTAKRQEPGATRGHAGFFHAFYRANALLCGIAPINDQFAAGHELGFI